MWLYFGVYLKWEIQVPESTSPLGPLGPTGTPTGPTGEMAPMPSETTTWGPGYPSKISGTSPAVHWKCIQMLGQSFTDQTKILKNIYIYPSLLIRLGLKIMGNQKNPWFISSIIIIILLVLH